MKRKVILIIAFGLIDLSGFLLLGNFLKKSNPQTTNKEQISSVSYSGKIIPTIIPKKIPTEPVQPRPTNAPIVTQAPVEKQIIKAIYRDGIGLKPSRFTVKAGVPVRFEVFAEIDGVGCMGSIMLPGLSDSIQVFEKGQTNVFNFTAPKPGEYEITCAMGIPHGSIIAN